MKKDIHPKVYKDCVVSCACGNQFTTISTLPAITVEICSSCHPFFTGQQKFVDTEGRIDKFQKKAKVAEEKKKKHEAVKKSRKKKKTASTPDKPPSLKELMDQVKKEKQ